MKPMKAGKCGYALLCVAVLAMLVGHVENVGAATFHTTWNGSQIGTINTGTAAGTLTGNTGFGGTFGAAFDNNDGTLYGLVNNGAQLVNFNLGTGAASVIGNTSMVLAAYGIEVADNGTMYAGSTGGNFYTLNKATGASTFVGVMGAGLSGLMDLAFDVGSSTLWATTGNNLWTINTSTGAATFQTAMSGIIGSSVMGIAFDQNNTLFAHGYEPNSKLYSVNTSTGAATFIGNTGLNYAHSGDILLSTEVPEPSTLLLLGTGLVGLVGYGRRKRRG